MDRYVQRFQIAGRKYRRQKAAILSLGLIIVVASLLYVASTHKGSREGRQAYQFSVFRDSRLAAGTTGRPSALAKAYRLTFLGGESYALRAASLPSAPSQPQSVDINENSVPETYDLKEGRLSVSESGGIIWQTPTDWWVDSYFLADSTRDGRPKLNMSVWKAGNYGTTPPFWEKENDQSTKNHFFVFGYSKERQKISPIWQSSNLEAPNCDALFDDVNNDGRQELIVIEGSYDDWPYCKGRHVAVWSWNGWGFANDWRSDPGSYLRLSLSSDSVIIE